MSTFTMYLIALWGIPAIVSLVCLMYMDRNGYIKHDIAYAKLLILVMIYTPMLNFAGMFILPAICWKIREIKKEEE